MNQETLTQPDSPEKDTNNPDLPKVEKTFFESGKLKRERITNPDGSEIIKRYGVIGLDYEHTTNPDGSETERYYNKASDGSHYVYLDQSKSPDGLRSEKHYVRYGGSTRLTFGQHQEPDGLWVRQFYDAESDQPIDNPHY